MTRLSRLAGIILHLQGKRVVRAEDMAEYFGVSVRTIYRDLRALEEAGLPVAAEAGKGYSLVEGYHVPPVMFTQEEAGALLVGGTLAEQFSDASLRPHVHSALMKVKAVLPDERKEFVERLNNATAIHIRRTFPTERDTANLTTVQQAVAGRRVVRIVYRGGKKTTTTEREVEPLGIVYYADNWHRLGYCRMRRGIRDFRADRIRSIELLAETFPERKDFVLAEHMEEFFTGGGEFRTIRVLFRRETVPFFADRHYFGFVEEREREEGIEMTFRFPDFHWFARRLTQFGDAAEVLEPEELREHIREVAEGILRMYREGVEIGG